MNQIIFFTVVSMLSVFSAEVEITKVESTPLITKDSYQFGNLIEGAGVNPSGEIFATHFGNPGFKSKLGKIDKNSTLFYEKSKLSEEKEPYLNAIRFQDANTAYVADVDNHQILKLDVEGDKVKNTVVHCENQEMIQPNDFVLTKNGTIFTSGQKYAQKTGPVDSEIWVCNPGNKEAEKLGPVSGRTNGITLSPKDEYLYITESNITGGNPDGVKIFKYKINNEKLSERELFLDIREAEKSMPDKFKEDKVNLSKADIDGIRTDVEGNLYITRNGAGIVLVVNPQGKIIKLIELNFSYVSSLEFGGSDGTTLFIVGRCPESTWNSGPGCVDTYKNNIAGSIWTSLQHSSPSIPLPTNEKCRQPEKN